MKKLVAVFIFLSVAVLTLMLAHCGTRISSNYSTLNAPGFVHVTNGTTVGFYKSTGGYAFSTQAKSIVSFGGAYGGGQPFAQNTVTGAFYFGTNNINLSNAVFYLNALNGGFALTTLSNSQIILQVAGSSNIGTSTGVAFSPTSNLVYVADPVNTVVTYLNATRPAYGIGGNMGNSVFAAPTGLGANFVGVGKNTVIVSESQTGSVYFMDANNGNPISANAGKVSLPLVNAGTPCNSASLVNQVLVNQNGTEAFVMCGQSLVYINLFVSAPNYFLSGSLISSTVPTTGVTTPKDFVYDSVDNTVIVVGGTRIISLDAQTGDLINSLDISTYNCGAGVNLAGVAYSSIAKQIYVTDEANSQVYVLGSSSFGLTSGECATSVFSTATDVPGPTKIGYY